MLYLHHVHVHWNASFYISHHALRIHMWLREKLGVQAQFQAISPVSLVHSGSLRASLRGPTEVRLTGCSEIAIVAIVP